MVPVPFKMFTQTIKQHRKLLSVAFFLMVSLELLSGSFFKLSPDFTMADAMGPALGGVVTTYVSWLVTLISIAVLGKSELRRSGIEISRSALGYAFVKSMSIWLVFVLLLSYVVTASTKLFVGLDSKESMIALLVLLSLITYLSLPYAIGAYQQILGNRLWVLLSGKNSPNRTSWYLVPIKAFAVFAKAPSVMVVLLLVVGIKLLQGMFGSPLASALLGPLSYLIFVVMVVACSGAVAAQVAVKNIEDSSI